MEPTFFRYVWRHSRRRQLVILTLVLLALPVYFVSLTLPKAIVNGPITGGGFEETGAVQSFGRLSVPLPDAWGGELLLLSGWELDRVDMLFALSFLFLFLVFVNGGFKFFINTMKGQLGERVLRRLRYELVDRVLRFPTAYFRKLKPAEVASMVKDEVEPLGGFIGDAIILPIYQGGLALTALIFIMMQSAWLGVVALAIVLIQAFLIPILRVPILRLARERQVAARDLSGRVSEIVEAATEIHSHDTSNYERADITARLGRIYDIRYEIFRRKFFVKFLNNFFSQVTPFIFYAVGGYLAIIGRMDIGALVAVIAAYKDLPGPVKELINWDHQRQDTQVKYEQVADNFNPEGMLGPDLQAVPNTEVAPLNGTLSAAGASLSDESGARLLDRVYLTVSMDERLAVVGAAGGGKEFLGPILARLVPPTEGSVLLDGNDIQSVPEHVLGRRMAYVGQDTFVFPASLRENLLYGLKHAPVSLHLPADGAVRNAWLAQQREAVAAGNSTYTLNADWVDYASARARTPEDMDRRMIEVLKLVDLHDDLYTFGLHETIDLEAHPDFEDALLKARSVIADGLAAPEFKGLVELFRRDAYNHNATVAENILFGIPVSLAFSAERLATNPHMRRVLEEAGLTSSFLEMGASIAETMADMFSDLPLDDPFFEQFSFVSSADLAACRDVAMRVARDGFDGLSADDEALLLSLPFRYAESRHRLDLIDPALEAWLLNAREIFARTLPADQAGAVAFFEDDKINPAAGVQDNLLLGRIVYGQAMAEDRVGGLIRRVLEEMDLVPIILSIGLDHRVGLGGKGLTVAQRQKLGLARALLKHPDMLIVDSALAVLESASQNAVVANILEWPNLRGLIWILVRPDLSDRFDRTVVIENGRVRDLGADTGYQPADLSLQG